MAFDQTTRNRLARFVGDCRVLLTEEFTRQLQSVYGMDPKTGDVAETDSLTLTSEEFETARLLRDTMEHYLVSADTSTAAKAKKVRIDVLGRLVREQAFTVLNRLCALRMSEARGLLIESIGKGYQSKGFQLYKQLAGPALGETGDAYRCFLFCVFDEFGIDLPVLFDRFSPEGRLFPREAALLEVLAQINDADIDPLWSEDETIGWIYQYFNSKEERKEMRDASQAPRNSRELAVRNQFFTPRYVVEFLTDNTLGRIWYEMTQGETGLKDSCRYLVRRPNEIFLAEGEEAPGQEESAEDLSQEELLKQPVNIPIRTLKDPRDIKMLDPACGSMHFGLYAFDLFERIYEEAWDLEAERGADVFVRPEALKPLHETYDSKEAFLRDVPRLIIERNIHGIDIDSRAVQIAGLSLWLRAQKTWAAQEVLAADRPQIERSNIVCAEPMPGEADMLEEFLKSLRDDRLESLIRRVFEVPENQQVRATARMAEALCGLVRTVWKEMELAGETGCLLRIEESLADAIAMGRDEWETKLPLFRVTEFGLTNDTSNATGVKYYKTVPGEDQEFWHHAESMVLAALGDYAKQAQGSESSRRRMFASDASRGFGLVDMLRKDFEVVLQNPPFGDHPANSAKYIASSYGTHSNNILCCFLARSRSLAPNGYIGSVVDRTVLIKNSYEEMRRSELLETRALAGIVDLGWGVLDANVEVSALVTQGGQGADSIHGWSAIGSTDKNGQLLSQLSSPESMTHDEVCRMPFASVNLHSPRFFRNSVTRCGTVGDNWCEFVNGHTIKSDVFKRLVWEVPESTWAQGGAKRMWNGSGYSPFRTPFVEAVLINYAGGLADHRSTIFRSPDKHGLAGICFGKRGDYLDVQLMHRGFVLTNEGFGGGCSHRDTALATLAVLNSRVSQYMINQYCGQHKGTGYVNRLPIPDTEAETTAKLAASARRCWACARELQVHSEIDHGYRGPLPLEESGYPLSLQDTVATFNKLEEALAHAVEENDQLVALCFGLQDEDIALVREATSNRPVTCVSWVPGQQNNSDSLRIIAHRVFSFILGVIFGRWSSLSTLAMSPEPELDNWPDGPATPLECKETGSDELESAKLLQQIRTVGVLAVDVSRHAATDTLFEEAATLALGERGRELCSELLQALAAERCSDLLLPSAGTFDEHLALYSKGNRKAPVYLPISGASSSPTLWLYYHSLTDQTLYTCVNDFLDPKLKQVSDETSLLRGKSNRSSAEEKELERLSDLELELKDFRDELLRIAKFWKPNLNDGVQITAAPLWKLFQHKPWQKRLKETWEKLEAGEYDWAHLALSIWPDRVVRASHKDRSYAIAHDLDDQLWHEVEIEKKTKGGKVKRVKEWRPRNRSESQLDAIVTEVKAR